MTIVDEKTEIMVLNLDEIIIWCDKIRQKFLHHNYIFYCVIS